MACKYDSNAFCKLCVPEAQVNNTQMPKQGRPAITVQVLKREPKPGDNNSKQRHQGAGDGASHPIIDLTYEEERRRPSFSDEIIEKSVKPHNIHIASEAARQLQQLAVTAQQASQQESGVKNFVIPRNQWPAEISQSEHIDPEPPVNRPERILLRNRNPWPMNGSQNEHTDQERLVNRPERIIARNLNSWPPNISHDELTNQEPPRHRPERIVIRKNPISVPPSQDAYTTAPAPLPVRKTYTTAVAPQQPTHGRMYGHYNSYAPGRTYPTYVYCQDVYHQHPQQNVYVYESPQRIAVKRRKDPYDRYGTHIPPSGSYPHTNDTSQPTYHYRPYSQAPLHPMYSEQNLLIPAAPQAVPAGMCPPVNEDGSANGEREDADEKLRTENKGNADERNEDNDVPKKIEESGTKQPNVNETDDLKSNKTARKRSFHRSLKIRQDANFKLAPQKEKSTQSIPKPSETNLQAKRNQSSPKPVLKSPNKPLSRNRSKMSQCLNIPLVRRPYMWMFMHRCTRRRSLPTPPPVVEAQPMTPQEPPEHEMPVAINLSVHSNRHVSASDPIRPLSLTQPIENRSQADLCYIFRCCSIADPSSIIGMLKECRICQRHYSIACLKIARGQCNAPLNECPTCWGQNRCFCGSPFSDKG